MIRLIYVLTAGTAIGGIVLTAYAPDGLTMAICLLMEAIIAAGAIVGILPVLDISRGFRRGTGNVLRATHVQASSVWSAVAEIESPFGQKFLDNAFREYITKTQLQRTREQVMSDVDDYLNEDTIALATWQTLVRQVPFDMTTLGILGTFAGILLGIQSVGFSSMSAAITSIQTLLGGMPTAFYTSIAGVILSITFSAVHRVAWNTMIREMGVFLSTFHREVVPTEEEQERYLTHKNMKQIITLLERLPRNPGYSVSGINGSPAQETSMNEQAILPRIQSGLKNGEFVFYLQPRYNLSNKSICGAEALVRWNHPDLGLVSPSVFLPILERNGYITQLDTYIWDNVFAVIRRWIDEGRRVVPVSVNLTKTDILAMLNVTDIFKELLNKYKIPPKWIDVEIAKNAYSEASSMKTLEVEYNLRQSGFRVIVDGFDGNYLALNGAGQTNADALKLDLRNFMNDTEISIPPVLERARELNQEIIVEGIESMEQASQMKKLGCREGQGYYFSKPVTVEEFESKLEESPR